MKSTITLILTILIYNLNFAIDTKTITDWSSVGNSFPIPTTATTLQLNAFNAKANDKNFDNSIALQNAIKSLNGKFGIIEIPVGTYYFKKSISIPSNIYIKGQGSNKTILEFNLGGNGDLFSIQGKLSNIQSSILSSIKKDDTKFKVSNVADFKQGDFILVKQTANNLLASNWAYNYFFQIAKIEKINGNEITIDNPLHLDFPLGNKPLIQKIMPVENVGIASLKIKRDDATTQQTSNLFFNYAVNCWVTDVESENCNYAHINLQSSAYISVSGNYLHDALNYGSGGKAYGVVMQFGASDNFAYSNIAQHLRHSFLLQATANGNVIAYNYSYNPYWTENWLPSSSAGDIVLHGNYPYANLIEGNIIQNLVIDNSHGENGPYNTFFRNRIENYGIVMNGNSGNNMNFIANEITGSGLLKGMFMLSGNQVEIGNTIKGKIQSGTVSENSLINKNYSAKIGVPYKVNSWNNEAYLRNQKQIKTFAFNFSQEKNTSSENINQTSKSKTKTKCCKLKSTRKKKKSKL
ncbi:MAG: hypothetical protein KDD21_03370 [Bacteroidetes bacterium]|nr:hypothetical protein [Bacteroidota bacterium]